MNKVAVRVDFSTIYIQIYELKFHIKYLDPLLSASARII